MGAPIRFTYGNCVFAEDLTDVWAAFAIELSSYQWLGEEGKRARFLALLGALEALEADVQILRVGLRDAFAGYASALEREAATLALDEPYASARASYAEHHARRLVELAGPKPALFVLVSLREPERDVASYLATAFERRPRDWRKALTDAFKLREGMLLKASELERIRVRADQAHARLSEFLPARQARGVELQWLVRRAFCRGLAEPSVDGLHEPRALLFERNGEAVLAPLEGDVLRWGSLVAFPWFFLLALGCAFSASRRAAANGSEPR